MFSVLALLLLRRGAGGARRHVRWWWWWGRSVGLHHACEMRDDPDEGFFLAVIVVVCYRFVFLCRGRVGAIGVPFDLVEQA